MKTSDTAADIKKAYRKAALRHHPDKVLLSVTAFNFSRTILASAGIRRVIYLFIGLIQVGQFLRGDSGYEVRLWKEIAEVVREDADRLFKIIGEAYAVLSDTSKVCYLFKRISHS